MKHSLSLFLLLFTTFIQTCLAGGIDIARLKYGGGGDWYNDPEAEANLLKEFSIRTGQEADTSNHAVSANDDELFNHPFLFLTGHGEIRFTEREVVRLRKFLEAGGFIYADDDYGMDQAFRRELQRILPGSELQELPYSHGIYHCFDDFPSGPPKIHEHQEGHPVGYGVYLRGRLAVYYTFNTNISDGWVATYNDPPEIREQAIRMGVNILWQVLTNP
jgi:hypothetical protein